ncbi:hypothetical protein P1P68_03375 [Streptomyces scabiei]|uniref:hypothetical protein n=1 Tax=Streptomyces scabiei TaxID=1930 RepID=UPI00298FBAA6|nr:hypothetical protein [Streptomyces scabiei]MDW8803854.1 hypothetical protein [Streptomyces scabiei]
MATCPDTSPATALGGGWTLRSADEPPAAGRSPARRYTASHGDGDARVDLLVRVQPVRTHPLRACYPYGEHDLVVRLDGDGDHGCEGRGADRDDPAAPGPEAVASGLLRVLAPALFAADARCRRVIAAPDEWDVHAQRILADGGFRRATEADLPGGSVVLFAAEPPDIAEVSTALDDMPH